MSTDLAALSEAATKGDWIVEVIDGAAYMSVKSAGMYDADTEEDLRLSATLVNAYRAGQLVEIGPDAVERAANAFCDVFSDGNAPTVDDMPNPAIYRDAMSAAIAALKGKE